MALHACSDADDRVGSMWRYTRVLTQMTGSADVALHACSDADDRVGSMWRYMRVLTQMTGSAPCGVTCVF